MIIGEVADNVKSKYLPEGSFRRDFATLSAGRIISQVIPLLVTPLLTRLYTPKEFGIYAIFLSLVTIISLISNGRYNLAITLPKKLDKATELFIICIIGVISVSLLSFLLLLTFSSHILEALSLQGNGILIFLVPIGVFIVASIESIYYWLLRKKAFGFLSLSFVVSTSVATILKVLFASYEMGWLGLVLAYLIGAFLSLLLLSFKFFKESNIVKKFSLFKRKGLFDTAKKYRKFPFYSMPADGLNSFTDQLPNLLLNGFFGSGVVGFYSLTQNVLGLPIKFISSAMTDVYRERASVDCREKGNCKGIFTSTLRNLVLFSIIPFLVIFFFSPIAIPFILGNQWYEVGAYIKILTPLFLFRFIASPLGSTLYIRGKQKILLLWQIVLLILTATSLYLGNLIGDEYTSLMLLSASYSIMYVILLLLGYKFSSMRNEETF